MPHNILIVDDEEAFQQLLEFAVKRINCESRVVSNATQAMNVLRQYCPDAIILDDMMPGMSGSELCMMLKKDPSLRAIPVIIYTSGIRYAPDELRMRCGADAVLIKSGKINELLNTLKGLLAASV